MNSNCQKLKDKVAIVTGGAKGLGRAAVEKFVAEGAKVAIWDLDIARGEEVARALQAKGGAVLFQQVNTALYSEVEAAAKALATIYGRIDILINNAGITRDASLQKMDASQWQEVLDVNLTGVFNCGKVVSAYMLAQGNGRIVNTSSIVGLYGNFGQSNYVAAKAGVIGLTKVWARELGRKGVTCNAVAPGFIDTDMARLVPEKVLEGILAKIPIGKMGQPADIANAYAFLASDEAAYINGAVLSVDGDMVG